MKRPAVKNESRTIRVAMLSDDKDAYDELVQRGRVRAPEIYFTPLVQHVDQLADETLDVVIVDWHCEQRIMNDLKQLKKHHTRQGTLLISPHDEQVWLEKVAQYAVDYCVLRPFQVDVLLRHIARLGYPAYGEPHIASLQRRRFMVEQEISQLLSEIGLSVAYDGHAYLKTAIRLTIADQNLLNRITRRLYPLVAEAHHVSPAHVERSMRYAIEVMWTKGNMELLHSLFTHCIDKDKGKPTNALFIARLADHLRLALCHDSSA